MTIDDVATLAGHAFAAGRAVPYGGWRLLGQPGVQGPCLCPLMAAYREDGHDVWEPQAIVRMWGWLARNGVSETTSHGFLDGYDGRPMRQAYPDPDEQSGYRTGFDAGLKMRERHPPRRMAA